MTVERSDWPNHALEWTRVKPRALQRGRWASRQRLGFGRRKTNEITDDDQERGRNQTEEDVHGAPPQRMTPALCSGRHQDTVFLQLGDDLVGHLSRHRLTLIFRHIVHQEDVGIFLVERQRIDLDHPVLANESP